MIIRIYNIGWNVTDENGNDVNGSYYYLPEEVIVENPSQELVDATKQTLEQHEITEELEDYLFEEYEFWVYEVAVEIIKTQEQFDSYLETKWEELEDIPFDEDSDGELMLSEDWYHFPKGTKREEIWHWFDDRHSKGVAWLLYGDE